MKIKGFDKNLCCRGMQFEIGKVYDTKANEDKLELCSDTVFHYCNTIQNVHIFYPVEGINNNRFCEIEVLGKEITDGIKCGSNKIKILREIKENELSVLIGKINGNTGVFNSGNYNSGNYNSGDRNSGFFNSGWSNSGNRNSGWSNSGNYNSGDNNSGYFNSGYYNSGCYNSCNGSSGFFNTEPDRVRIFNMQTDMTQEEFRHSKYYAALTSADFPLVEWKDKEELIKHTYKEACAIWWGKMTKENKEIIQQIPNFNKKIFKEITGIDV